MALVKFNENNLCTTFIKSLLSSVPIPIYNTLVDGDYASLGSFYIYKQRVIKILVSGIIDSNISNLVIGRSYTCDNGTSFYVESNFFFGEYYVDSTRKYNLHNSYYDSQTHKVLGKYLDLLRGYFGLDLYSFYNCFNGEIIEDSHISLDESDEYPIKLYKNNAYKIYAVPIKFNTPYTIYMYSPSDVMIMPTLLNKAGFIQINKTDLRTAKSYFSSILKPTKVDKNSFNFNRPYLYGGVDLNSNSKEWKLLNEQRLYGFEENLYLLIQTNFLNESSLVVLDGNFVSDTKTISETSTMVCKKDCRLVINADKSSGELDDYLYTKSIKGINELFRSKPSLTIFNDNVTYAFSDELVQYLLNNVITNVDWVEENFGIVQEILGGNYENCIWDNSMRVDIYNKYLTNYFYPKFDFIGFVNRDCERYLQQNKSKIVK